MPSGQVIWFDLHRGFGFIRSDEGTEVFVSYQNVEQFGKQLRAGDSVRFDVLRTERGPSAVNVVVIAKAVRQQSRTADKQPSAPPPQVNSTILLGQALVAKQQKHIESARKLFEKAIEIGPPRLEVFYSYAAMEKELRNPARARAVFERGIQLFPASGKLYEDYGMLELRADPAKAADIFRLGLEKAPRHRILHRYLGEVLFRLGGTANLNDAARHLEQARRAGLLDERREHLLKLSGVLTGNTRGRLAAEFLEGARLPIQHIRPHRITTYAVDFYVKPQAVEYIESYDLSEEVLVRCLFKNAVEVKDVQEFLGDLQRNESAKSVSSDVGIMIVQNSHEIRDYLYRLLEGAGRNPTVVPIDEDRMRNALVVEECEATVKQILDEWLYRRNLYDETFPVSGRRFFGREHELASLTRAIDAGTPVGLFGLRKVGKTSLLKKLKEKRPLDIVLYIDLQSVPAGVNDATFLYWELANQIRQQLIDKYPELAKTIHFSLAGKFPVFSSVSNPGLVAAQFDADLRAIKTTASWGAPKVIVLLDEIERLLPTAQGPGFKGFIDFLGYLRGRSQQDPDFISIVTGANPAVSEVSQWERRDNPTFKFYRETFLPPLERAECDEMVTKLGRGMGISYDEESLAEIYNATGGHPFVTRQLCSRLAKLFSKRPLFVNTALVRQGIDEFLFHDSGAFREILDRLDRDYPQEKELLLFIADGVNSDKDLMGLAGADIQDSLRHLVGYQLVERDNTQYRIKIGLLLSWVRRHWLKRESS